MKQLHFFTTPISGIQVPKKFTFPFYYEPHQLAEIAVKEVQNYLENQTDFTHNFGLCSNNTIDAIGKMFGVLVVKNREDKFGFIVAFSGKLEDESCPDFFVPPVFDLRTENSFFRKGEQEIEKISAKISFLKNDEKYLQLKIRVEKRTKEIEHDLELKRKKMKLAKKNRKHRKQEGLKNLTETAFLELSKKLTQESFNNQFFYKELVEYYEQKNHKERQKLINIEDEIYRLKEKRKEISADLQKVLFEKFQFLNQQKEPKALLDIFNNTAIKPPAGSGECAAPKLLQFAFKKNLSPICMAEFWWGISPNSAVRKHKNYYAACLSRCKPILKHMLTGIEMDDNVLINQISTNKSLEIIYEDDELIVVNKPA